MRVAILDDYQGVSRQMADWDSLKGRADVTVFRDHLYETQMDALVKRLDPFEIIVTMRERTPFPKALLERLPNLKLLLTTGMVNRSFDMDTLTARKVQVCGTNAGGTPTVDIAWGLILNLARQITVEDRAMRDGKFQITLGNGVRGKTLGILGLGKLGALVAAVGKALGMNVIAWSQNLTAEKAAQGGATRVEKDELFQRSDFITIHLVLSDRTRSLVGARELGLMKKTAFIVNTSRGPIIDEKALVAALTERRIGGAGLDVFDIEPLPADHPLRKLDNTVLTPHLGYVTEDNLRDGYSQMLECITGFLDGKLVRPVNKLG